MLQRDLEGRVNGLDVHRVIEGKTGLIMSYEGSRRTGNQDFEALFVGCRSGFQDHRCLASARTSREVQTPLGESVRMVKSLAQKVQSFPLKCRPMIGDLSCCKMLEQDAGGERGERETE